MKLESGRKELSCNFSANLAELHHGNRGFEVALNAPKSYVQVVPIAMK